MYFTPVNTEGNSHVAAIRTTVKCNLLASGLVSKKVAFKVIRRVREQVLSDKASLVVSAGSMLLHNDRVEQFQAW